MRLLLVLVLLVGIGAGVFYKNEAIREKVRGWQVGDDERERFEAYMKGKTLFRSSWDGSPNAKFQSWGDDPSETAGPVKGDLKGDIWIARGHVTVNKGGSTVQEQWCLAFDREKGTAVGRATGKEAEETLRKIDAGELQKTVVQSVATPKATPAPAPGSWMWKSDGRSALDQPVKKTVH